MALIAEKLGNKVETNLVLQRRAQSHGAQIPNTRFSIRSPRHSNARTSRTRSRNIDKHDRLDALPLRVSAKGVDDFALAQTYDTHAAGCTAHYRECG